MLGSRPQEEGARSAGLRGVALANKVLTVLAGVCVAFGALWLLLILGIPVGPLGVDTVASGFVWSVTVWVVADLLVRWRAKRGRVRSGV